MSAGTPQTTAGHLRKALAELATPDDAVIPGASFEGSPVLSGSRSE